MDTFYTTNNTRSHTLSSIPYTQVSTNETQENENLCEPTKLNYRYVNIGEGLYSQVDKETLNSLKIASSWGYLLCFIHLLIGVFLFFLAGVDDYFYLICIAFVAHTFSVCLGIFSISRKNVLLIINYTIYGVVILAITISVFIISTIVSNYWFSWWVMLSVFFFINVQIFGIKYLFNLAMVLKGLQTKELQISANMIPAIHSIPVQTVTQPSGGQIYVPQPQFYYVTYPQNNTVPAQPYYPPQPVNNAYYNYPPTSMEYSNIYPAQSVHNV